MQYRKLGKTNLRVSAIGLGTWQYCGDWGKTFDANEVGDILRQAQENGVNFIDTAECYGNHLSEQLIGEAMQGMKREDWVISTKYGHTQEYPGAPKVADFSAAGVLKQLEDSLKSLRTDYVDIYLFHSGSNQELENDELWDMLRKQVEAGKIRHLGISLHPGITDNIRQTQTAIAYGAEVIEALYNRLERIAEDGVFPLCQKHGLGVIGRVPLCSGYLSGKYKSGAVFSKNDIRETYHDRAEREEKLARAAIIQECEVPSGQNMAEWAIAWCLKHAAVSSVISGFKNPQQIMGGVRAAKLLDPRHPLALD